MVAEHSKKPIRHFARVPLAQERWPMALVDLSDPFGRLGSHRWENEVSLEMVWVWLRAVDFNASWSRLGTP